MTEPETKQPVPDIDELPAAATATEPEAAPAPEPEPWTPERVSEWNAYYDRYVMGAALLLALVVSCNYVADSSIFLHLRAGKLISEHSAPVTTDEFSYTEAGQRWVNVPWLFQWAHAALYDLVRDAVPTDPMDPTANRARADKIAMGALGLLDALVRLALAWVLLRIRHRGPGLWWSAICVTLAVGMFYDPISGFAPGGLASVPGTGVTASTAAVMPATWGLFFLAFELLVLFRAFDQGRPGRLWWLIPLFVLWANCDVSFLTGLVVLAAVVAGHWLDGGVVESPDGVGMAEGPIGKPGDGTPAGELATGNERATARPVRAATAFLILGLCIAACLANPSTFRVFTVAIHPFIQLIRPNEGIQFRESLSFFSGTVRHDKGIYLTAFYLITVAVGIASFLLNAVRFSWRRFLPFAAVAILWGCLMRYSGEFALVFAAVIALNGQEWYQARFGTGGRLGAGWTLWSTGGRLVTLALIFAAVGLDITGWHVYKPGVHFGLGYNPDSFAIEAAEFLERQNDLRGNVLNTSTSQGDVLLWKAYPKRKTFIDGRTQFFSAQLLEQWHQVRLALRDDIVEQWKPVLDEYKISVVMIEPLDAEKTYGRLKDSPNWIPFYDDGRIVMFGRKDAPAADLQVFQANRLEPARLYHATNPLPPSEGPPTPTSWIDDVFQNRALDRAQMRTQSAWRWLMAGPGLTSGQSGLPEPARCLLAIQDARIALSRNPDDAMAFRILNEAYRLLTVQETALMAGLALTPENQARISMISPPPDRLMNRFRQRVTALNYAIQTSPTPVTDAGRDELFDLNMQLYELYSAANFHDLARDRLGVALALNPSAEHVSKENRVALQTQFDNLDQAIKQIEAKIDDLFIEQQPRPVDLAMFARQQGAIGVAITKLAEAESSGDSLALVKPQLLDLYCSTGQPDKAQELLNVGSIGDPNLGSEPGIATYRQGLVYYLLGNYLHTASLWNERSLPQVRMERSNRALSAGRSFTRGEVMLATNQFLGIPDSLERQATWEFDVAICQLEAGLPDAAAEHFTKSLTLAPNLTVRPIAAYYLEKMGKPVPPKREATGAAKPAEKKDEPVKPAEKKDEPAKPAENKAEPAKPAENKAEPVKPAEKKAEPAKTPASEKAAGTPAPAKKADDSKVSPR